MIDANYLIKLLAAGILAVMPFIIIWAKQISILQKILASLSLILGILLSFSIIATLFLQGFQGPRLKYDFIDLSNLLQEKEAIEDLDKILSKNLAADRFSEAHFVSDLLGLKDKIWRNEYTNKTYKPSQLSEKAETAQ